MLVAAIAIVVSMGQVRDQLRTSTFLAYTDRYTRTMGRLPFDARQPGSSFSLAGLPQEQRAEVLAVFRDYFNMCSEEMWLKSAGRIDTNTWKVWRDGMKESARSPAFAEAWRELATEYHYFSKFRRFMNALIEDVAQESAADASRSGVASAKPGAESPAPAANRDNE